MDNVKCTLLKTYKCPVPAGYNLSDSFVAKEVIVTEELKDLRVAKSGQWLVPP